MKKQLALSFLAGCLLTGLAFWGFLRGGEAAVAQNTQLTPTFPGYQNLKYVSSWVVRNEVWHDYTLSEEARAAGVKINSVLLSNNVVSIQVSP